MNKVILISLGLAIGMVLGVAVNDLGARNAAAEVYAVCQESRMSATINETQCGELQDSYHIEFLCEQANTSPANHCWTEVK